jgi:hypothetical protein
VTPLNGRRGRLLLAPDGRLPAGDADTSESLRLELAAAGPPRAAHAGPPWRLGSWAYDDRALLELEPT